MIGRTYKPIGLALVAILGFPGSGPAQPAPAPKTTPEQSAVIAAAVRFSVGYKVWLWEKKCQSMPADMRRQFDEVVTDDLKRLTEAADAKLMGAVTSAGQSSSGDSPACGSADAAAFGQFGLKMAKEAQDKLKTLPPGYRMVIAD